MRVLLIEDDRETAAALTALLELEGARVSVAMNGTEALQMLPHETVDAIVSDIGLPDIDGYELMRKIRANAQWAGVLSVVLTGHDREKDVQTAREAGFDVHLGKPLDFQQLFDTLGTVMRGRPDPDSGSMRTRPT